MHQMNALDIAPSRSIELKQDRTVPKGTEQSPKTDFRDMLADELNSVEKKDPVNEPPVDSSKLDSSTQAHQKETEKNETISPDSKQAEDEGKTDEVTDGQHLLQKRTENHSDHKGKSKIDKKTAQEALRNLAAVELPVKKETVNIDSSDTLTIKTIEDKPLATIKNALKDILASTGKKAQEKPAAGDELTAKISSLLEKIEKKESVKKNLPLTVKTALADKPTKLDSLDRAMLSEIRNQLEKIAQQPSSEHLRNTEGRKVAVKNSATPMEVEKPGVPQTQGKEALTVAADRSESSSHNSQNNESGQNSAQMKQQSSTAATQTTAKSSVPSRSLLFDSQLQDIMSKARITVRDGGNSRITLKLYPKELGSVQINLGMERGVLHGKFLVDTPQVRDSLMDNLDQIKEQLAQEGISLGGFQVDVRQESKSREEAFEEMLAAFPSLNSEETAHNEYNVYQKSMSNSMIDMTA